MWPFPSRRGPPKQVINNGGIDVPGAFQLIWTRKRLPDPGAEVYAFETLDLPETTPIGAGVAKRRPTVFMQSQMYFPMPQTMLQGIGTVSGGVVSQPLFNPQAGYSGIGFQRANDPFPRAEIQPAARNLT